MKKAIILLGIVLLISGCTNINKSSYDEIISEISASEVKIYNTYRKGYKFYLPIGLYVKDSENYNEVIKNESETFYLYIDLIGYLNKESTEYEIDENAFYSRYITAKDKTGYVEVKVYQNDKYLVEIAYNYAKIEVIVEESRLNKCISDAMIILSSIEYNDSFLESLSEESLLSYKEENVDIFEKSTTDSDSFLKYVDEYDTTDEAELPDYDKIN